MTSLDQIEGLRKLKCVPPPFLEAAFGYAGTGALVGFYFDSEWDTVRWDDGATDGDADGAAVWRYLIAPPVASETGGYLGYQVPPTWLLLVGRVEPALYLGNVSLLGETGELRALMASRSAESPAPRFQGDPELVMLNGEALLDGWFELDEDSR